MHPGQRRDRAQIYQDEEQPEVRDRPEAARRREPDQLPDAGWKARQGPPEPALCVDAVRFRDLAASSASLRGCAGPSILPEGVIWPITRFRVDIDSIV